MPINMYVALQDDDKLVRFSVEPETGKLDREQEYTLSGAPSSLAISPNGRTLYVGHRTSGQISSHRIDSSTGALTENGRVNPGTAPTYLATDRKGNFLLGAYYQGAHVGVHPLSDDGSVGGSHIEWIETATGAHAIQVDRSNRFAFVPHIARIADNVMQPPGDTLGPNAIYQYQFDENTGRLTPNTPPIIEMEDFLGPRHYCFHPSLDVVYFSNEQGCSVSAYSLDTSTGTLTLVQTVTTLPQGFSERNTCSQIQISPSGKFLYAPNRGNNSIAAFTVDSSSGRLTPVGHVPTEQVPSAFSLDPEARFIFAAGSETDRLASYRVNGETGELTPLEIYSVGKRPMAVLITNP